MDEADNDHKHPEPRLTRASKRLKKESEGSDRSVVLNKQPKKSKPRRVKEELQAPIIIEKADEKETIKNLLEAKTEPQVLSTGGDMFKYFVGAHVSAAGGVYNAVTNAHKIGCKAFALFLKSQRQWNAKPLEESVIQQFKQLIQEYDYPSHLILPHGSYLMNCGSPDPATVEKSTLALIEEMTRCEKLGLSLFNFHPGSTCGKQSVEKSVKQIATSINRALDATKGVTAVIENMSCQGNTLGGKFEEIKAIIDYVEDKRRVGVCIDTCHAYAAGFDLTSAEGYEKMWQDFDSIIGLEYLKAMHINDSKGDLGCHRDRHKCIGEGKLGISTFKRIMNDPRLQNIPLILETPDENRWEDEIKKLYSLQS